MTKEEMIEKVLAIKNVRKEKAVIYQIAKELGLNFKPTNCNKCLGDYVAILKEELGIISSAAEESSFDASNYEYEYLGTKSQAWNGHIINQDTDPEIIREFIKRFPTYYRVIEKKVEVKEETTIPQQEETINNNE